MEKQIQILLNRLSGYASYEDKMKWLNTGIVGNKSQMSVQTYIDKVPGLREQVNEHMVNTISVEQGNPESAGFTFSTEYSNAKLLEILNKFEAGETKIANIFGETEVQNTSDEILELQEKILKRNTEQAKADTKVSNLQEAVKIQRKEFDERSKYSILNIFPGMPSQAILGLTDLARDKGLEQIENRDWNWDPKYKRFGAGPELKKTQENLDKAYKDKRNIKPTYQEKSDLYDNYKQIIKAEEALDGLLNQTGVDEALNYVSMEQLTKILESQ